MSKHLFGILLLSVFCGVLKANEFVPTLIWGKFSSIYEPAIKSYSTNDFTQLIVNNLNKDTATVVFVENHLSPEDLSGCKIENTKATCFSGLNNIKSKTYLSSVENPLNALEKLFHDNYDIVQLTSDAVITDEDLVINKGEVLFIKLNDIDLNEDKNIVYARHDKFISSTYQKLSEKYENLIAVYTAEYPSYTISSHVRNVRQTVDVMPHVEPKQDEVTEQYFLVGEKVLIYFKNIAFRPNADSAYTNYVMTGAVLNENSTAKLLNVVLTTAAPVNTFALTFVEKDGGSWFVTDMKFNDISFFIRDSISANLHFSYTCAPTIDYMAINDINQRLQVTGFQVEPRFIDPPGNFTSFSEPWDCVGFTSPAIWGGLFVVFILLLIITVGISWMLDIRTMDRFDDPKGKTIIISQTD